MSKVYSFRLDVDNPREAQAESVINTWISQGFSLRHILTEALINYQDKGNGEREWERVYDQLSDLVRELEGDKGIKESISDSSILPANFVGAMKEAAKEGIKMAQLIA